MSNYVLLLRLQSLEQNALRGSLTAIFLSLQIQTAERNKGWSSWTKFGPCDDKCQKIRQRFCMSRDRTQCPGAGLYGIQKQGKTCTLQECYGRPFFFLSCL